MSIKVTSKPTTVEVEVHEQRRKPRFELTASIPAKINGLTVRLVDVSACGVQLEHPNNFRIGTVAPLVIDAGEPIELMVRVIWSHFSAAQNGARTTYRSGAEFCSDIEPIAGKLGRFLRAYGRIDQTSLQRKREYLLAKAQNRTPSMRFLSREEIAFEDQDSMVRQARAHLASDPEEALKWYNRAKFALAERFDVSAELAFAPHKQEVLAVWEYLGRRVEIARIVRAFERRR